MVSRNVLISFRCVLFAFKFYPHTHSKYWTAIPIKMKQKQTKRVHKSFEEAKNIVTGSTSKFYRPLVSQLHRLPSILHEFKTAERNRSIIISTIYINENRYKSSYSLSFYRCVCVCVHANRVPHYQSSLFLLHGGGGYANRLQLSGAPHTIPHRIQLPVW